MAKTCQFNPGDFVVYPAHGVGKVTDIARYDIGGEKLDMIVVSFDKDKMAMKIPSNKAEKTGLRPIVSEDVMTQAVETLRMKPKIKKTMWSRRSMEYEAKINSGDPCQIAEVIRDLHKTNEKSEQSYSEHQMFEVAFTRLSSEYAAQKNISFEDASQQLTDVLSVPKFK